MHEADGNPVPVPWPIGLTLDPWTLTVPGNLMDLALSYLERLAGSGYFGRQHQICDGVWFVDHPACRNAQVWEAVKDALVQEGLVAIRFLPQEMHKALGMHPKDTLDTWWFELTPKGQERLGILCPMPPA